MSYRFTPILLLFPFLLAACGGGTPLQTTDDPAEAVNQVIRAVYDGGDDIQQLLCEERHDAYTVLTENGWLFPQLAVNLDDLSYELQEIVITEEEEADAAEGAPPPVDDDNNTTTIRLLSASGTLQYEAFNQTIERDLGTLYPEIALEQVDENTWILCDVDLILALIQPESPNDEGENGE
jgi:hypothetical protein